MACDNRRVLVRRLLPVIALASFIGVMLVLPPLPQAQAYHDFADQRELIHGVPNTLNVLSNAPFLIIAVFGLVAAAPRERFRTALERYDALVFFVGIALTGVGSAIYHWKPSDAMLPYDRLGMTVGFMAFVAMLIHGHYSSARWMLPVLLLIGLGSIWWWVAKNDLRPYGWVQFFPILLVVLIVVTEKPVYTAGRATLFAVFAAYASAKVLEASDKPVYRWTADVVSGHTLKHLAAAAAPLLIASWITSRRVLLSGHGQRREDRE